MEANAEAFNQTSNGDTTIVRQLLFDRLDGLLFELSSKPKSIRLKYELEFFQYTIDDNPAGPIGFTIWTDFRKLDNLILPDNYGSHQDILRTFKFLGYDSQSELANFIFKSYPELKAKSLEIQRNFYNKLVIDERFIMCCPEYIEQAEEFINSDPISFDDFESLSIELVFKSTLLEIIFPEGTEYLRIDR